ncbi:MAG: hypothetical protein RLZZ262_717 [Bacteroidota bacterium]
MNRATPEILKHYFDTVAKADANFSYRGPFLDQFTEVILEVASSAGNAFEIERSIQRKMSFILVESFQNILKHASIEEENQVDNGLFSFRLVDRSFIINSINFITKKDSEQLCRMIEVVNEHNRNKTIKEFYMQHLQNNELSEKGGAGLGLIELARKSGSIILYEMEEAQDCVVFHQQITMRNEDGEVDDIGNYIKANKIRYEELKRDGVFLSFSGEVSQKNLLPLLSLVESNAMAGHKNKFKARKAGHALIEVMQNISRYAKSKDTGGPVVGYLNVGLAEEKIFIIAGNTIDKKEKYALNEKLDQLTQLSEQALSELHQEVMKKSIHDDEKLRSGLGLIEVLRSSSQKVDYGFYPTISEEELFSMLITV